MEAWVSTKRVNAFLQLEELSLTDYYGQCIGSPILRPRICSDISSGEEEGPMDRGGAVNFSGLSYHYFSPNGSVSGASTTCSISIHGGCFTWTCQEGRGTSSDLQLASAGGEQVCEPTSTEEEAGGTDHVSWSLADINVTIKPVSSAWAWTMHCK
jgi:hypothetical protein